MSVGSSVANTSAATGLVPSNHFDHYVAQQSVAKQSVAVPKITEAAANSVPMASTSVPPRVIPPSLFLDSGDDDDNDSYDRSQTVQVPGEGNKTPSPFPLPTMDPSSSGDVSDTAGADELDVSSNDGADHQQPLDYNDEALPDDEALPNEPLHISLGPTAAMEANGLAGHLSASLEVCFTIDIGAVATYWPPGLIRHGVRKGPYVTKDLHSVIPASAYGAQAEAYGLLQVHADDAQVLSDEQLDDLRFFNARATFLFQVWNTFHACTSMSDIKHVLEQMSGIDHVFLLVLHAAYANYDVDFTVTFGQAKSAFYSFEHQGKFEHGSFDTFPENTPVSSMRVEYLLARTMPQMLSYLSYHEVPWDYLPFDITADQMNLLSAIPNEVHARFDLGVYISCTITGYLSEVYSDEKHRYQLLHRQLHMASTDIVQGFRIAALDANIFVQSLFKHGQYPCSDMMNSFGQQLLYRDSSSSLHGQRQERLLDNLGTTLGFTNGTASL